VKPRSKRTSPRSPDAAVHSVRNSQGSRPCVDEWAAFRPSHCRLPLLAPAQKKRGKRGFLTSSVVDFPKCQRLSRSHVLRNYMSARRRVGTQSIIKPPRSLEGSDTSWTAPICDRDGKNLVVTAKWSIARGQCPYSDAHAMHYASCGVSKANAAYNGTVFKSREHSERLRKSAKTYLDF